MLEISRKSNEWCSADYVPISSVSPLSIVVWFAIPTFNRSISGSKPSETAFLNFCRPGIIIIKAVKCEWYQYIMVKKVLTKPYLHKLFFGWTGSIKFTSKNIVTHICCLNKGKSLFNKFTLFLTQQSAELL